MLLLRYLAIASVNTATANFDELFLTKQVVITRYRFGNIICDYCFRHVYMMSGAIWLNINFCVNLDQYHTQKIVNILDENLSPSGKLCRYRYTTETS